MRKIALKIINLLLALLLIDSYCYGAIFDDVPQNATNPSPVIANVIAPNPSAAPPQEAPEKIKYIYSDWDRSIMFDNEKVKKLNEAINKFKNAKSNNLPAEGIPNDEPKISSMLDLAANTNFSPSFYLGSIIFNNPNEWVIWINRKKLIAAKKTDLKFAVPGLEIIAVKDDYASFNWSTKMLDLLSPNWQSKLTYIQKDGQYVNKNKKIVVHNDIITFSLYPNQSFSVYDMAIVEGYKAYTKISSTPISSEKPL
jgi:hypothetical protein